VRRIVPDRARDYFRRNKSKEITMRIYVMKHDGLTVPLSQAGCYETNHHKQLMLEIPGAIPDGRLVALSAVIGQGKTVMLERIQQKLVEEKRIIVMLAAGLAI
jgi:type II secretory pathway predicted ATPase ExeA